MKRKILVGGICFALSAPFLTGCTSGTATQTEQTAQQTEQAAQQQEQSKEEAKEAARKQALEKLLADKSIERYLVFPNEVYGESFLLTQSSIKERYGTFEITHFYSLNTETGEYEQVKDLEITTGVGRGSFRAFIGIGDDGYFYMESLMPGTGAVEIKKLVHIDGKYALDTAFDGQMNDEEVSRLNVEADRLQWVENTLGQND